MTAAQAGGETSCVDFHSAMGRDGSLLDAEQAGRILAEGTFSKRMIDIPRRHLEAATPMT